MDVYEKSAPTPRKRRITSVAAEFIAAMAACNKCRAFIYEEAANLVKEPPLLTTTQHG